MHLNYTQEIRKPQMKIGILKNEKQQVTDHHLLFFVV